MEVTPSHTGLKQSYLQILSWFQLHDKLGFWILLVSGSFLTLGAIYLLLTNWRLHRYIRVLKADKLRLMEEKDLMRRGMNSASDELKTV